MHRRDELVGTRPGCFHGGNALVLGDLRRRRHLVERLVAERAPHPLERAGVRVEDDDAPIAVAVGYEQLVGRRMHERVRGLVDVLGVLVALALAFAADLHHKLAVLRELHQVMIRRAIAAQPYEALRVGVDTVFCLGPVIARAWTAPAPKEISGLVEHQHRRRSHGLLVGAHGARALQDPGVTLFVDRDAGNLTPNPLARQLRPGRLHLELRRFARLRTEGLRERKVSFDQGDGGSDYSEKDGTRGCCHMAPFSAENPKASLWHVAPAELHQLRNVVLVVGRLKPATPPSARFCVSEDRLARSRSIGSVLVANLSP